MSAKRRAWLQLAAGALAGSALAACRPLAPRERKHFVLVHGAWHGPWCWERLAATLAQAGHAVSKLDLHGGAPFDRLDLAAYTLRVTQALDALAAPAILVGHSSGGIAVSQAAEERPDRVAELVFLSGFVMLDGEAGRARPGSDPQSKVPPVLLVDFAPGSKIPYRTRIDTSRPDAVKLAFYNDCSDTDARAAIARLVPEPVAPSAQPLRLSAQRFGRVPKAYVFCARDNAISPAKQREYAAKWPLRRSVTLDSGHSSFLSMPAQLAQALGA